MASVLPPELIPDDQAALIKNMRLLADGTLSAVPALSATAGTPFPSMMYVCPWQPVYLPAGILAGETGIFIGFDAGKCYAIYKVVDGVAWKWQIDEIASDIQGAKIQTAQDATQFMFVDGRDGKAAQRIVIDESGAITCATLGLASPSTPPAIRGIEIDMTQDNAYTGMPVGSTMLYCYCVVNQFGERSNPSPVTVYDQDNQFIRGEYIAGEYEYSDEHRGSIRGVQIACEIPEPERTERVEIYRAACQFSEDINTIPQMTLVQSVPTNGASMIAVTDSKPESALAVDSENDVAPAGDDIAMSGGIVYIANAVNPAQFDIPFAKAWQITITNQNSANYVNQWLRLVLYGETQGKALAVEYLVDFEWTSYDADLIPLAFYDSDRKTILDTYLWRRSTARDIPTDTDHDIESILYIRIPNVPALSDKTIYLLDRTNATTPAITLLDDQDQAAMTLFLEKRLSNPVRDKDVIYAAKMRPFEKGGDQSSFALAGHNSANINESMPNLGSVSTPHVWSDGIGVLEHDIQGHNIDNPSDQADTGSDITLEGNWDFTRGGYAFIHIQASNDGSGEILTAPIRIGSDNSFMGVYYRKKGASAYAAGILKRSWTKYALSQVKISAGAGQSLDDYAFLYVSWGKPYNDGGTTKTDIYTALIQSVFEGGEKKLVMAGSDQVTIQGAFTDVYLNDAESTKIWMQTQSGLGTIVTIDDGAVICDTLATGSPYIIDSFAGAYIRLGEYCDDPQEVLAFQQWLPHYPTAPIGYRGQAKAGWAINTGIAIQPIVASHEKDPGRVRWSRGGAVPELHERHFYDEIIRIEPMRSFMPTIEHNTLIVFTASGRVLQSLIDDTAAAPIVLAENARLISKDSLVRGKNTLIWATQTNIYVLGSAMQDISTYRVPTGTYRLISNPLEDEILFVPQSGTEVLVYNTANDTWTSRDYGIAITACLQYANAVGFVSGGKLYAPSSATLTGRVVTKGIPATARIRRIILRGTSADTYAISAIIHHHRAGISTSPTYAGEANVPIAIPNLTGEIVQFDIIGADAIKYIDIEDSNAN